MISNYNQDIDMNYYTYTCYLSKPLTEEQKKEKIIRKLKRRG